MTGVSTSYDRSFVMLGAGGHAKVVLGLLRAMDCEVVAVADPALAEQFWEGVSVESETLMLERAVTTGHSVAVGIGHLPNSSTRHDVFQSAKTAGLELPSLIHPTAWVAPDAIVHDGVQLMAGSVVQPGSVIGQNTIINTHASVDHDCKVGADCHIAPGATLCGGVELGENCFVGAGATIVNGVSLPSGSFVKAGSLWSG